MKNTPSKDFTNKLEKQPSYYIEPKSLPTNDYAQQQGLLSKVSFSSKDNKPDTPKLSEEKASFESTIPAPSENTVAGKQGENDYENELLLKKQNAGSSESPGKKAGKLQKSYAPDSVHPNYLLDSNPPPRYDAVMMEEYV